MNNPAEIAILILMFWAVVATYWALQFKKQSEYSEAALIKANAKLEKLADLQLLVVERMELTAKDLICPPLNASKHWLNFGIENPPIPNDREIERVWVDAKWNPKEGEQEKHIEAAYAAQYKALDKSNDK